jgi:hypothetical protein
MILDWATLDHAADLQFSEEWSNKQAKELYVIFDSQAYGAGSIPVTRSTKPQVRAVIIIDDRGS